jgi:hypothetical protein
MSGRSHRRGDEAEDRSAEERSGRVFIEARRGLRDSVVTDTSVPSGTGLVTAEEIVNSKFHRNIQRDPPE